MSVVAETHAQLLEGYSSSLQTCLSFRKSILNMTSSYLRFEIFSHFNEKANGKGSCYLFAMFMPSVKWMEEVNIALEEDASGRRGRWKGLKFRPSVLRGGVGGRRRFA